MCWAWLQITDHNIPVFLSLNSLAEIQKDVEYRIPFTVNNSTISVNMWVCLCTYSHSIKSTYSEFDLKTNERQDTLISEFGSVYFLYQMYLYSLNYKNIEW